MDSVPVPDSTAAAHPAAVAAMRARLEGLRGEDGSFDVDVLARYVADHVRQQTLQAGARGVGKDREQRKQIRALKLAAQAELPQPDREEVLRAISGCLTSTIQTHGPITPDLSFSAAKRVYGHLVSRRYLRVPEEG